MPAKALAMTDVKTETAAAAVEPRSGDAAKDVVATSQQEAAKAQPSGQDLLQPDDAVARDDGRPPSTKSRTPPMSLDIDKSKPQDFDGELATTDELPSPETLRKIDNYVVLDRHGKTHTFQSLYSGRNVARRVLVVFVRHFFCGNCQEYLRSLSESIKPEALLRLPISTFVVVVGCGDPALIDMYVEATACPFPVYTDPTRSLFDELGMVKTLALGEKPAYMKRSMLRTMAEGISQGLRSIPRGLALKSGDQRQVGGEFLFEPLDAVTPISTPQDEKKRRAAVIGTAGPEGQRQEEEEEEEEADDGPIEEKRVTWCHRMRTTRDHAEIPELMEILGLDGHGQPIKDEKRWSKALQQRKGTGLSMASEMSKIGEAGEQKEQTS
ncbi:fmHP [Purpureocillium lavendulum]|uniref:FmHP n=1 Tax=Purpureocillium lavendulum TaxID=1247861 RepID=A0AB34FLK0_9HYPO|nr:fmHP [Purpureocillium lavendulum]